MNGRNNVLIFDRVSDPDTTQLRLVALPENMDGQCAMEWRLVPKNATILDSEAAIAVAQMCVDLEQYTGERITSFEQVEMRVCPVCNVRAAMPGEVCFQCSVETTDISVVSVTAPFPSIKLD